MSYRDRSLAEQCMIPGPPDEVNLVAPSKWPDRATGATVHDRLVSLLAEDLTAAFESRDVVRFAHALRALVTAAIRPRGGRS